MYVIGGGVCARSVKSPPSETVDSAGFDAIRDPGTRKVSSARATDWLTVPDERIHRDLEIRWFYSIVAGLPIGFGLLALAIGEWIGFVGMTCIGLIFLVAGWPLTATVTVAGDVIFAAPFRRVRIGVDNLSSVKVVGPDYLPHLVLRRRWRFPVGYRFPNFTDAKSLAADILRIIEQSGARVKDERVLRILKDFATSRV